MKSQAFPWNQNSDPGSDTLVVSLETLDQTALPPACGKAANLGELIHAGFAVPAGFCITTAVYERVAGRDGTHTWIGAFPSPLPSERFREPDRDEALDTQR
jgi:phosphoenolpyruvate synthase/pyruvate phosphate dikinase